MGGEAFETDVAVDGGSSPPSARFRRAASTRSTRDLLVALGWVDVNTTTGR
jgi:hypothetical protein